MFKGQKKTMLMKSNFLLKTKVTCTCIIATRHNAENKKTFKTWLHLKNNYKFQL